LPTGFLLADTRFSFSSPASLCLNSFTLLLLCPVQGLDLISYSLLLLCALTGLFLSFVSEELKLHQSAFFLLSLTLGLLLKSSLFLFDAPASFLEPEALLFSTALCFCFKALTLFFNSSSLFLFSKNPLLHFDQQFCFAFSLDAGRFDFCAPASQLVSCPGQRLLFE
jgi:hypothetical protein